MLRLNRIKTAIDRTFRNEQNQNLEKIEQANGQLQSQIDGIIDGHIDDGVLATNIEQKLNNLETEYAPKLTEVTSQLVESETDLNDRGINIKRAFGAVGDGLTDDTLAFQTAINEVEDGQIVFVPPGHYKISVTLTLKANTRIIGAGKYLTFLDFQGVNGIVATDKDNIAIKSLQIRDVVKVTDTIGLSLLDYCNYHKIEDVFIDGFGKWGIYQEGGLDFQYDRIDMRDNGRRTTLVNDGGSFFVDRQPLESTTGLFTNIYLRNGGYYGFKIDRIVNATLINFIVEYHVKPLYAFASTGVLINFYEEANTHPDMKVHLKDCNIAVFNYRGSKPVRTYEGYAQSDREGVTINRDITSRYMEAQQYILKNSTHMNPHIAGAFSLSTDGFPRYSKGGKWYKLFGATNHEFYTTTTKTYTYNLGSVQADTAFEIEVNLSSSALLSQRYHYKRILVNTGSSSSTQYRHAILNQDVNSTTPFITTDITFSVDANSNLIMTFATVNAETIGTVILHNKRGNRTLELIA